MSRSVSSEAEAEKRVAQQRLDFALVGLHFGLPFIMSWITLSTGKKCTGKESMKGARSKASSSASKKAASSWLTREMRSGPEGLGLGELVAETASERRQ